MFGLTTVALMMTMAHRPVVVPVQSGQPNVVLILLDDVGYNDLSCYGSTEISTPYIDSLAKSGVRMTNAYVVAPICAPSRAGLLTGRYPQRFGFENNLIGTESLTYGYGMPTTEMTLAQRLKDSGYATGLVGKWHVGEAPGQLPMEKGFDHFFGFLDGASPYMPELNPGMTVYDDMKTFYVKDYLTEVFTRRALHFIDDNRDHPFFLYLAYNAAHNPLEAPDYYKARYPGLTGDRQTYAAMLSAADDGVHRIKQRLKYYGLSENTIFVFLNDNGGLAKGTGVASNAPFRGSKDSLFEGGVHVPFILSWPGKLPEKKVYDQPVSSLDIFPTVISAISGKLPSTQNPLDGVDLLPYLLGNKSGAPHDTLYWRLGTNHAIRDGKWKWVYNVNPTTGLPSEFLFDLSVDVGETTSVKRTYPDVLANLKSKWQAWNAQLPPPGW